MNNTRTVQETAEEYDISEERARRLLDDMTENAGWVKVGKDEYELVDSIQATKFVAKHKASKKWDSVRDLWSGR